MDLIPGPGTLYSLGWPKEGKKKRLTYLRTNNGDVEGEIKKQTPFIISKKKMKYFILYNPKKDVQTHIIKIKNADERNHRSK